ncbi:MAG: hypothetical protein PVG71_13020 [Anaerolineae bacterium]
MKTRRASVIERIDLERSPSSPPASTFVVRLWHEATVERPRWRGRIEHLQSGEAIAFVELEEMVRFLRRFGVDVGERGQPMWEEA